ncbi:uncharacterized protein G2W53_031525 [Senna tora]|uniref:Uncharacterized protein n=1 Tax=Senna tora TaxID=362788 RepID=A0A834T9E0_9FABA|nr:uncharacterized protein G2W53_031525 [Senna tora]
MSIGIQSVEAERVMMMSVTIYWKAHWHYPLILQNQTSSGPEINSKVTKLIFPPIFSHKTKKGIVFMGKGKNAHFRPARVVFGVGRPQLKGERRKRDNAQESLC